MLGLWGLVLVLSNGPGASGGHFDDYVLGIVMSLCAVPVAIWAIYDIWVKPGLRGQWLAGIGIAGGTAGFLVAFVVN